ncbi:MAG: nicotinate phosphoribosyltransferase [Candidatus Omnitrophica bacterium]|nr:nicotinate phosphoribosyltransferase [Candidatus Omnitrophota bacterium]
MVHWKRGRRLPPEVFNLPVGKIKSGWYSDKYFLRTKQVLIKSGHHPMVTMQVFCREKAVVCGIDESIAVLKLCSDRPKTLQIEALHDGDPVTPWEPVMHITGDYAGFAHLETVYLGILSRRTSVATAVKRVVNAARGKQVLFFPARFDHYAVQTGDGYAAYISGALGVSTDANAAWWGEKGIGTIPHGLIAAYGGDTVQAATIFDHYVSKTIKRVVLVDFENDCVDTSIRVARALGRRLWGVRLDTAGELWDQSMRRRTRSNKGVCPELVRNVRRALDRAGYRWVRIIVSGGFTAERISKFIRLKVPFDAVGVGSAFLKEKIDFTADIVKVDGFPCAKVGRRLRKSHRLKQVRFS